MNDKMNWIFHLVDHPRARISYHIIRFDFNVEYIKFCIINVQVSKEVGFFFTSCRCESMSRMVGLDVCGGFWPRLEYIRYGFLIRDTV